MDECDLKIISRMANPRHHYLIVAGPGDYRRVVGFADMCHHAVQIAAGVKGQQPRIYQRVRGEYRLYVPREVRS